MKTIILLILLACACNTLKFEGGIFAEVYSINKFYKKDKLKKSIWRSSDSFTRIDSVE